MDINTKKLKKNAFRVSKVRGLTASRVRVPGGCCNADVMQQVVDIARKYGNGQIHVTTRQGFEIEGIHMEDMDKVNEMLQPIIDNLQINQNEAGTGYSASGTRNVCACIGNRVCPFGNYNTAAFAKRIEKAIFPNDLHFKIALTGCANDCIKARMHDFGIIGMTEPQYDPDRCVSCGACVKGCDKLSVDALKMDNYRIVRNEEKCVGCGVCVTKCPTRADAAVLRDVFHLGQTQFTGQHDPGKAQLLQLQCALQGVHAHLGGAVARQLRGDLPDQGGHRQILADHGIGSAGSHRPDGLFQGRQLGAVHGGVQCHMHRHAAGMAEPHRLFQAVGVKIAGSGAGIEARKAQVDRIRPAEHGGTQHFFTAHRGKDLNLRHNSPFHLYKVVFSPVFRRRQPVLR